MFLKIKLQKNSIERLRSKVSGYTRKRFVDTDDYNRVRNLVYTTIGLECYCGNCRYDKFDICQLDFFNDAPKKFQENCCPHILQYLNRYHS